MSRFSALSSSQQPEADAMAGELYPDIFAPSPITTSSQPDLSLEDASIGPQLSFDGPGVAMNQWSFDTPRIPSGQLSFDTPAVLTNQLSFDAPRIPSGQPSFDAPKVLTEQRSLISEREVFTEQLSLLTEERAVAQREPMTGALNVAATQSLVSALQATMTAKEAIRKPVVIPGTQKRDKKEASRPVRRLHPGLRVGITLGSLVGIVLISLLTLAPLSKADSGIPLVNGLAGWAHTQEQNLNAIAAHVLNTNPPAANTANTTTQKTLPPPPPVVLPTSQYVAIARQDAVNAGISPDYFTRQIMLESGFNPNAISPSGAVGIAQFLPSTAAGLGFNPYDPVAALNGAAKYMANLSNQYGGDYSKALAAYNAGSGTVNYAVQRGGANWLSLMPAETQNYVARIMGI